MNSTIVYYTDGRLKASIADKCLENIYNVKGDMPIVEVRQGKSAPRSHEQMILNILSGIRESHTEFIYLAEHDVLYQPDYFTDIEYPNSFMQTISGYYLDRRGYYMRKGVPLSAYSGRREAWCQHFSSCLWDIRQKGKLKSCEPSTKLYSTAVRTMSVPYVDIRHGQNYTGGRNGQKYRETIPYWDRATKLWKELGCTA